MREQVEATGHAAFKIAFIGSVAINGLVLWLFFHRRRPLVAENMVTALHLSCIAMTLTLVLGSIGRWLDMEVIFSGVIGGLFANFGTYSIRRVNHNPSPWLFGPCLVVIISIDVAIVTVATAAAVNYQAVALV